MIACSPGFLDRLLDLFLGLLHFFLDAARVDAAVLDQPAQRQPGHLAAHRIEAGDDHRLRRIVDDQVDAGRLLDRPDVAALAADDAPLHLVVGQRHAGYRRLRHVVGSQALDRPGDDLARPGVGLRLHLGLDLANLARHVLARFLLDDRQQLAAWRPRGSSCAMRSSSATCCSSILSDLALTLVQLALPLVQLAITALELFQLAVQHFLTPLDPFLRPLQLPAPPQDFLF